MKLPQRVLQPRSIAVFGGIFAERVIQQCDRMGYAGAVWPVHPKRREIAGHPCFKSTVDLPGAPDAAFLGINRIATLEAVRQLCALGAGGAIAYASGFKEVGDQGNELQKALLDAAGGMPVIGPNCYGIINYLDGALLWPDVHGGVRVDCGVAILSQSSNIGLNLTMSQRGLPMAYLITLGNQAMVGAHDVIQTLVQDERVSAIGLYLEGISDANGFAQAISHAHKRKIPVVVLKAGRTQSSVELSQSHTASLAGSDAVMDAYFKHLGVARVNSLPVLLETLKILHLHGPLKGRSLVSMSCSGGEASLVSDSARGLPLSFRPFTEAETTSIANTVNPLVTVSNPFDYHTFDWGDYNHLLATFTEVLRCKFDLALLVLDFPNANAGIPEDWAKAWNALADAAKTTGSPAAVVASLPESLPPTQCDELTAVGLVPLLGVDEALNAINAAAFVDKTPPCELLNQPHTTQTGAHNLSEYDSKQALVEYGINIPRGRLCKRAQDALDQVHQSKVALAMKATGPALAHKTEIGGVKLRLQTEADIVTAYDQLKPLGDGVLAEEMISDGIAELIIGAARDSVIGLHLVVGSGGILAETLHDSVILLLPTTHAAVVAAIRSLRLAPIYEGIRGRPAADINAAADAVMAVQEFVLDHLTTLEELDINPLIMRKNGHGAVAADAFIRKSK